MEKLKCSPFACFTVIFSVVFGLTIPAYFNLDSKVTKIYEILIQRQYVAVPK